jgi:HK97 family phage prohead protease
MEKSAGIVLEFKDLDTTKRTAVIKHAVYTSIDRVKDISTKGMFTKSWNENKPDFLLNHIEGKAVGMVKKTFEDDNGAYTEVKFGNWTLGNDVLEMADEGALKGASFGYVTEKKDFINIKGQKVRKLLEVRHIETSLLTVPPAHPEAGIITLNKSLELIDENDITELLAWNDEQVKAMKTYVQKIETYCHKAKASDESIITLQNSLQEYKKIISEFDTAVTQLIPEPVASDEEVKTITNFLNLLNVESWKLKHLKPSLPS